MIPASQATALRFYAALLQLYPQEYHQEFGTQMLQTFRDDYREAQAGGRVGLEFWLALVADEVYWIARQQLSAYLERKHSMNTIGITKPQSFWNVLGRWLLASALGWSLGAWLAELLTQLSAAIPWVNEDRVFVFAALFCIGLCTGAFQALAMPASMPRRARWLGATLLGFVLAGLVLTALNLVKLGSIAPRPWNDLIFFALTGVLVALPQFVLLRPIYRNASIWLPASAIGFLSFLWLVANPAGSASEFVVAVSILGMLASLLPAAAIAWLLEEQAATTD